jgi:hypothetical protein
VNAEIAAKVTAGLRRTGAEFESVQPGKPQEFVTLVADAYSNLLAARKRFAEPAIVELRGAKRPDHYDVAWYLLWGAATSAVAAWTLLERGYPTEPLTVLRHAMEKVAAALVLFDNPAILPKFWAGKLGNTFSTQCIGPACDVIGQFDRTYGMLSEFGAHVSPESVLLPSVPGKAGTQPALAVAGDFRSDGPEREYWAEATDTLFAVVRDILVRAPEHVFFSACRRPATFPRGGRPGRRTSG